MNKKQIFQETYPALIVFACFFVFLLIMQQNVYLYSDDFGYASLSYLQVTPGVSEPHFNILQFFEYFRLHYLTATGRIFYQSLTSIFLNWGLPAAHVMQAAIITLLMAVITYLISRKSALRTLFIAIVVCCLYGFFQVFLIDKSIYWYSAAAIYMWSLPLTLIVCYIVYKSVFENKKLSAGNFVLLCICAFLNSTAHEQVAVIQIFIIGILYLCKLVRTKKLAPAEVLVFACAIAGLLFVELAPATSNKIDLLSQNASYADFARLSMTQRLAVGMQDVLKYVFSKNFFLLILALLFSGCWAALTLIRKKHGPKVLNIIALAVLSAAAVMMLITGWGVVQFLYASTYVTAGYITGVVLIAVLAYVFILYFIKEKKYFQMLCFIAAWLSLIPVMFAFEPTLGRVYIPFAFLLVLIMGDVCASALEAMRLIRWQVIPLALMAVVAAFNMAGYTALYASNATYYIQNDNFLQYASFHIQKGEDITSLPILQYGNIASDIWRPDESVRLTYLDPAAIASIKCFYGIPQNVEITWYN